MVLVIASLVLALITLPLLAELAVLTAASWFPARKHERNNKLQLSEQLSEKLTIVIPAHDEELLIERAVRTAKSAGTPEADVLVIAHNCSDRTAEFAAVAGARVLRLDDASRRGKGCALEIGFEVAISQGADVVLVMDADSVAGAGLVDTVRAAFAAGADVVQTRYEVENPEESPRARLMQLALLAFNGVRPSGRERLGLSAGILGNGFAVRADVLRKIPYNAFSVVEDLEYHLNLVRSGYRVRFLEDAVMLGQMPVSASGARTQRARWEGGRKRMRQQWSLRLAGEVLRGRLRLMEPLLDLISQPLGNEVLLLIVALLLPVGWLRIYASFGLMVLALHILTAARRGQFWNTMRALTTVPGYLVWKLRVLPDVWKSSAAKAGWIRTERFAGATYPPDANVNVGHKADVRILP